MSARDVYGARGFGGRQGAGRRPAVVVVDFIEGFTDPASTLACDADEAVDALQYGYRVLVPRDAVADRAVDAHNGSLLDIDAKYGDVISIDEAIRVLEAAASAAGRT
jgi:nicotinamidase-related amidase